MPSLRPTPPMEDKRRSTTSKIGINSCIISSPIKWAFNNIINTAKSPKNETNPCQGPSLININEETMQVESSGSLSGSSLDYQVSPKITALQAVVQNPAALTIVAAYFKYWDNPDWDHLLPTSPTNSHATMDKLHLGHLYKEHTKLDTDLPNQCYERLYLIAMINPIDGDPCIIGKADQEGPPYNEGQLTALPVNDMNEDIEDGTRGEYCIRGDTYLSSQFLIALSSLADQGLNTECLCIIHADAKTHALRRWEQGLEAQEWALLMERQGLEQGKRKQTMEVRKARKQLQKAKFTLQMTPLLPDHPGALAYSFPCHVEVWIITEAGAWDRWGCCHWYRSHGLETHWAKDCNDPHKQCWILRPHWCVIPHHHSGYWSFLMITDRCLY